MGPSVSRLAAAALLLVTAAGVVPGAGAEPKRDRPPVLPVLRPPDDGALGRPAGASWWAVDGHVHTEVTRDAAGSTLADVRAQALRVGLDAVVVTEHNAVHAPDVLCAAAPTLYPGEEAGFEGGHLVVWGGARATRLGARRTLAAVVDAPRGASARDQLTVLAHPGWDLGADVLTPAAVRRSDGLPLVDAVEVWNGQLDRGTDRVLARWEALLAAGLYVPAVGFSDSHGRIVGWPRTMVLAADASLPRLIHAVRLGRAYVTDDGWAELDVLGRTFGGLLHLGGPTPLAVRLRVGTRLGGRLRLIVDGAEVAAEELPPGETVERFMVLGVTRDGWLRIEVRRRGATRRSGEAAVLIGNPVRWDVWPPDDFWR